MIPIPDFLHRRLPLYANCEHDIQAASSCVRSVGRISTCCDLRPYINQVLNSYLKARLDSLVSFNGLSVVRCKSKFSTWRSRLRKRGWKMRRRLLSHMCKPGSSFYIRPRYLCRIIALILWPFASTSFVFSGG